MQCLFLAFLISRKNVFISVKLLKIIAPLLLIFLIGFVGYFINMTDYELTNVFKDFSYFTKPLVCVFIGYFVFRQNNSVDTFFNSIIFTGFLTATVHLTGILFFSNFFGQSVNELRGDYGLDSFIEIFAFYLLLFYKKKDLGIRKISIYNSIVLVLLFTSIIFYFSRTMLVVLVLVGLSMAGYAKITKNSLKFIGICIIFIALFYTYLYSVKFNRNASGIEGFFYKVQIAPEEIFKTKIDKENHKDLWDHWRGYEAKMALMLMNSNPYSYLTGTGHGSLVNLKFEAPLSEDGGGMRFISRLHNGYVFVLYKTGLPGLALVLLFLFSLYKKIYKPGTYYTDQLINKTISSIGVFYLFSFLIISGVYVPKDIIIFALGGALYFETVKRNNKDGTKKVTK